MPPGPSPAASPAAKSRTYSRDVQPLTSVPAGQGCRSCHASVAIGTYDEDRGNRFNIARMARINGKSAGLTEAQIQAMQDWVAAGAPADSTPF